MNGESSTEHRRSLTWVAHRALVLLSITFFGWLVLRGDWDQVPRGAELWLAIALYTAAATVRPLMWVILLNAISGTARPPGSTTVLTWRSASRARTTRYLPGRVVNWGTRFVIATQRGYSNRHAAESIALDSVLAPVALLAVAVAAVAATAWSPVVGFAMLLVSTASIALALTHARQALRAGLAKLIPAKSKRLARIRTALAADDRLEVRGVWLVLATYLLWSSLRTLAFAVLAVSMTPLETDAIGFAAFAGAAGALAGQLVILVPMGLGVREGVAAAILDQRVDLDDAAAIVGATRVLQTLAEIPAIAVTELVALPLAHDRGETTGTEASSGNRSGEEAATGSHTASQP